MKSCLTHLALHLRDLEACPAFYRGFCGMATVRERKLIFVLLPGGILAACRP